jgi:cytochrome c
VKQKTLTQKTVTPGKKLLSVAFGVMCATGFASMVHPFGRVKDTVSAAPLLADASAPPEVVAIMTKACQNCHSEKTEWPLYSRVAPMSWMIEKDVSEARSHMNLSRWNSYDSSQRQDLLSRIGSMVRNHKMPLSRYLLLHPEARLSDSDVDQLYQWTRYERKRLRVAEPPPAVALEPNPGSGLSGAGR